MGGSWILSGVLEAGQCSNQETIPLDPAPTEKPGLTPSLVNLSGFYVLTVLCSSITGAVVLRKRGLSATIWDWTMQRECPDDCVHLCMCSSWATHKRTHVACSCSISQDWSLRVDLDSHD